MRPTIPVRLFGRHFLFCQAFSTRPCSSFKDKLRPLGGSLPSAFRGFKSSPISRTMEEMQHLDECIETMGLEKWGWIFYRCTYSDNKAWSHFKQKITQEMQEELEDCKSPELTARLSESLDLKFFEDKDAFNGASKDQLRAHFRQRAADAFPAENPRGIQGAPGDSPFQRYRYFIQIDDDALRSINENPPQPSGFPRGSYVNFVDGYWESLNDKYSEERFEPIEGCVEENVGWMKLATIDVCMEFYVNIGGTNDESWCLYYKRPPVIVMW